MYKANLPHSVNMYANLSYNYKRKNKSLETNNAKNVNKNVILNKIHYYFFVS